MDRIQSSQHRSSASKIHDGSPEASMASAVCCPPEYLDDYPRECPRRHNTGQPDPWWNVIELGEPPTGSRNLFKLNIRRVHTMARSAPVRLYNISKSSTGHDLHPSQRQGRPPVQSDGRSGGVCPKLPNRARRALRSWRRDPPAQSRGQAAGPAIGDQLAHVFREPTLLQTDGDGFGRFSSFFFRVNRRRFGLTRGGMHPDRVDHTQCRVA